MLLSYFRPFVSIAEFEEIQSISRTYLNVQRTEKNPGFSPFNKAWVSSPPDFCHYRSTHVCIEDSTLTNIRKSVYCRHYRLRFHWPETPFYMLCAENQN